LYQRKQFSKMVPSKKLTHDDNILLLILLVSSTSSSIQIAS